MGSMQKIGLVCAGVAAASVLSGCIISGSNRSYTRGTWVSQNTLANFEAGYTTYDDIENMLGVPTRTINRPDGSTVLVYEYRKVKDEESGLLFVFHSETYKETQRTTFIEVVNGVYERSWIEVDA